MANRVSNEQLEELLEFLQDNPGLARGVGLGIRSKENVERLWNDLAVRLNSLGSGSTKTGEKWKKYWADLKHKSKARLVKRKSEHMGTGGGPSCHPNISDLDEKILAIVGEQAVYGDMQHKIPFNHTNPVENCVDPLNSDNEELPDVTFKEYQTANSTPVRQPYIFSSQSTAGPSCSTHSQQQVQAEMNEHIEAEFPEVPLLADVETASRPKSPAEKSSLPKKRHQSPAGQLGSPAKRSIRPQPPKATKTRLPNNNEGLQPKPRVTPAWVAEIERKRVEAETKLANAAMIMAEASRQQSEAAMAQIEINRTLLEIVRRQSRDIHNILIMMRGQSNNITIQPDHDYDE